MNYPPDGENSARTDDYWDSLLKYVDTVVPNGSKKENLKAEVPIPQPQTSSQPVTQHPKASTQTRRGKKKSDVPPFVWLISFTLIVIIAALTLNSTPTDQPVSSDSPAAEEKTDHSVDYDSQYVGSVNSDVIHRNTCRYAENILEENRVYYSSLYYAELDGKRRCSTCLSKSISPNSNSGTSSKSENDSSFSDEYLSLKGTGALTGNSALPPLSVTPPENGYISYTNGEERVAPLTIETQGTGYYYVKLKDAFGKDVIRFFVHGGESAEIQVPLGEYTLVYATGSTWYGYIRLFGDGTSYAKADELFEFYEDEDTVYGWTVKLYTQLNGNLDTVSISADEF